MRPGLPTTTALGGTEPVITAPAPIIALLPMVRPGRIVALAPIDAPRCTIVGGYLVRWRRLRGIGSLVNVALGPTKTSSSSRTPSHTCTPHLIVTRSPITTSFSMNTPSQMLQSAPIVAFGSTCANAQMRVRSPIFLLSTSACGWAK